MCRISNLRFLFLPLCLVFIRGCKNTEEYGDSRSEDSKVDITKQMMQTIVMSLDAYKIDNRSYPSSEQGMAELVNKKVIPKIPQDGWGRDIEYTRFSCNSFWLKSYGRDQKPGGEGYDADILLEVK